MDFEIALLCIIAIIFIFPYARYLMKRIILLKKLKQICKKKRFRLMGTSPLWFLSDKYGKKCDFYIETKNQILAVKLFGMKRRNRVLILNEKGEFIIRRFLAFISTVGQPMRFPLDSKPKKLPVYHFRYQYQNDWEIKTPRNILLINPICLEIKQQSERKGESLLGVGDVINGMEIYSLSRLLGDLENLL